MPEPTLSDPRKCLTIPRPEFAEIIERSSFTVPDRTRERLRKLAQTTPRVAFGWFHCDGVTCPARQIGYRSQAFQSAFDTAMARYFELELDWHEDGDGPTIEPRVVEVTDG